MSAGYDIPAELAGHLRIGTCSWKYDSWKGVVYDPGRGYRPEDYLADYARQFNTVEIVNNHYEGSAPLTIQRLLELLR